MSKERWGEGNVYLRGKTYWIHYSTGGRTFRESSKSENKTEAQKLLRKRLSQIDRGESVGSDIQRFTVKELLDDLKRDYALHQKSVDWCGFVVNHLLDQGSPFRYMKAARVGTKQISEYIEFRRAKVSNSTINRELALLRHAFYLGTKCEPPKVGRVPKIPKLPEAPARKGFFDREKLDRLVKELPPEIGAVAKFAFFTGCRKAEILNLRWDWVDLKHATVSLPPEITKGREARLIPLVSELVSLLNGLKHERDEFFPRCPWVFTRAGRQIKNFYASWRSACARAELPEGVRYLHDMRRSGVRNLVRAGVPERVAMAISGHKTRSVFDRYNIVSESDLKDAAKRLEEKLCK